MHNLFKKTILCFCALLLVCMTLGSCVIVPFPFTEGITDDDGNTSPLGDIALPEPPEGLTGYYYDQLNKNEKSLYALLLPSLEKGSLTAVIENTDYDLVNACFSRAVTAIYYDRPDLFRLGTSRSLKGTVYPGVNDDTVTVTWDACNFTGEADPQNQQTALERKIESVLAGAAGCESDYEKAKFVHDYLVRNTVYDKANMYTRSSELNSPYSCLVEGKAVCGGYARAFQLLMNRLGIECITVSGTADGGPHAWNAVALDGETYFVDVTWDDSEGDPFYAYFGLTSAEMQKTHTADTEFKHPVCTATKYNYYRYEGLLLDTYSFEAVSAIVMRQTGQAVATVRFTSEAELQKALDDLLSNQKLLKIPGFEHLTTLSVKYDKDNFLLYISFPQNG